MLKIKPLERYVGNDPTFLYIGLRADEDRQGYLGTKPNITPVYPFREDGITKEDVFRILEEVGVGLPAYYRWRTRSGCYFCFFQRKREWIGLMKEHPDLFEAAKRYEKFDKETGRRFTWNSDESLEELSSPRRVRQILEQHEERMRREKRKRPNLRLVQILDDVDEDEDGDDPCLMCHL